MFEGSGQVFTVFGSFFPHVILACINPPCFLGFEYNSDPAAPDQGYIQWISDGKPSVRMAAAAVPPDPEANGGSGVGQRLIPVEPMVSPLDFI